MLLDAALPPTSLSAIPTIAHAAESMGFNTLWSSETVHDPFLPGPLVAEPTPKLKFGTAIAVSFGRSPATMAYTAWDLAQTLRGRFILGLGTQVRAHIERRFGLPWPDSPLDKLREQMAAIRAFWKTWQTGEKLNYRGEYYQLTLMSPFFNPGPIDYPQIPIYIAGVNSGMARLAGEVADGFLVHPWLTNRQKKSHFGQILPIEDVEYIVDQVRSIVRLPCICRKINTGNAKRYCYAVGRGCRQCQKKCYFDAIRYDRRQQKCQVDIRNCYGCGTCRATCQEDAISLLDRRSIPLVADSW